MFVKLGRLVKVEACYIYLIYHQQALGYLAMTVIPLLVTSEYVAAGIETVQADV